MQNGFLAPKIALRLKSLLRSFFVWKLLASCKEFTGLSIREKTVRGEPENLAETDPYQKRRFPVNIRS